MKVSKSELVIKYLLLSLGSIVMLYPIIWMLLSSFRPEIEIFNSALRTGTITLDNYRSGWRGPTGVSFGTYYINSFTLVVSIVIANVLACTVTAFAFARITFTGKKILFVLMLGTLMLPYHVVLIPRYIMFNKMGLVNTFFPMIIPKILATDGFFIFLITQFMRSIPVEFDQSAAIDGCSTYGIFSRIMIPLMKPVIITTIIFSFIWNWNDFLSQLLYLSKPEMLTVTLGLRLFLDATGTSNWGGLFAMSMLSLIPIFIIFISAQKYLASGVTAGGLKG